jgi:pyridoxine/pyridoxamine 5'-phosphate oxidase
MSNETAEEFVAAALRHLVRGVKDRKSPFHVIALASVAPDGAPRVRNVVLRGFRPEAGELVFHTDRRAAKFEELTAEPRAAVVAYDEAARLQIRLRGAVSLQPGRADIWDRLQPMSRLVYRAATAPGAALSDAPALDEAAAREAFVVCVMHVNEADVLHLAAGGHRRAVAVCGPGGIGQAGWVGP